MSHPNSSTSNSDARANSGVRTGLRAALWTVVALCVMDGAVNVLFAYPSDPGARPSSLVRYFEYGRSVEGKLPRIVGPTDDTTAPIAFAGWLDRESWKEQPVEAADPDGLLLAVYGMSFGKDVGQDLEAMDPRITMRFVGGPAAPPNHTYAAYTMDRGQHHGKAAMMAILASSVRGMGTLTGMTVNFEQPFPFTYPEYRLEDGVLTAEPPRIDTLAGLRSAMADPVAWDGFTAQLREHDGYYSPLLFEGSVLDHSAIVRMMRRAWAQRHNKQIIADYYDGRTGFREDQPFAPVLKAMVADFARTCREDGIVPIVYLVNDQGYGDGLYRLLQPTLEADGIPFISSHVFADAANPANFVGDGHFTHGANDRITEAVHSLLVEEKVLRPLAR